MTGAQATAIDIMEKQYAFFYPEMRLDEAVALLVKHNSTGGPVIMSEAEPEIVGFLSVRDCFRKVMEAPYKNLSTGLVEDYMRQKVFTIDPAMPLFELVEAFLEQWYHLFPVCQNKKVLGIVTRQAVLRSIGDFNELDAKVHSGI